jgi:hypothetical protein
VTWKIFPVLSQGREEAGAENLLMSPSLRKLPDAIRDGEGKAPLAIYYLTAYGMKTRLMEKYRFLTDKRSDLPGGNRFSWWRGVYFLVFSMPDLPSPYGGPGLLLMKQ